MTQHASFKNKFTGEVQVFSNPPWRLVGIKEATDSTIVDLASDEGGRATVPVEDSPKNIKVRLKNWV